MRDAANIADVASLQPDYMGFIYYRKSPRYVGEDFRPEWDRPGSAGGRPLQGVRKVAVFVDEPLDSALDIIGRLQFDAAQLHGHETPDYCRRIKETGAEVVKSFGVGEDFDFRQLEDYEPFADHFLFDAKTSAYGGSGKRFGWEQLRGYEGTKPFFLSGGLDLDNLEQALGLAGRLPLHALDLNSCFESAAAFKNIEKVSEAIRLIRQHDNRKITTENDKGK